MPERVAPNPHSPYANADLQYRHLVPGFFGIAPEAGTLSVTACDRMTVVPGGSLGDATDALFDHRFDDLPDGLCPECVAVASSRKNPDVQQRVTCKECAGASSQGERCALCRQEMHDAWWPTRDAASGGGSDA